MKKKPIVLIIIGVVFLAICVAVIPYGLSMYKEQANKQKCEDELKELALVYLEENKDGFNRAEWTWSGLRAEGLDDAIVEYNETNKDGIFKYPYNEAEFYFTASDASKSETKITVRFERDQAGEFVIVGYEVSNN